MFYAVLDSKHHVHARSAGVGFAGPARIVFDAAQYALVERFLGHVPVEVCSVNRLKLRSDASIDAVFKEVTALNAAPDHGGWRPLSRGEEIAFAVSAMAPCGVADLARLSQQNGAWLAQHPFLAAGGLFAFSPALLPLALIRMLADLGDPLRFRNPARPGSLSALKAYYRVDSPRAFMTLAGLGGDVARAETAHMALSAWYDPVFACADDAMIDIEPRAFLWRYLRNVRRQLDADGYPAEEAGAMSLWKTTRRFVQFVVQVWMAGLGYGVFNPERFFEADRLAVEAFEPFRAGFTLRLDETRWAVL